MIVIPVNTGPDDGKHDQLTGELVANLARQNDVIRKGCGL